MFSYLPFFGLLPLTIEDVHDDDIGFVTFLDVNEDTNAKGADRFVGG
jgi:hypothetical protein